MLTEEAFHEMEVRQVKTCIRSVRVKVSHRVSRMNSDLSCLRDPICCAPLVEEKDALVSSRGRVYPIVKGIPRFVSTENYSADFGLQWNRFSRTQLDSFSGLSLSESRLARCLPVDLESLKGKRVLEAGSGAGRFTEILLRYGAIVHSFDYSSAVEANALNNGNHPDLVLVQGDIREIPFPRESYDYVICLGVLQHTPCPEESIDCLWEMLSPNGSLVIDHYPWKWRIILPPPIGEAISVYRRIILALPRSLRFKCIKAITEFWFSWHWRFKNSPFMQRVLRRLSPVIFYYPQIDLPSKSVYLEWSLMDTHDATTDVYKHRRTVKQIRSKLESLGGSDIIVREGGNGIEACCMRPS